MLRNGAVLGSLLGVALAPIWVAGLPPGDPRAIAVIGSRALVGTERGLYLTGPSGYEPLFTRGAVRDVSVQREGALVATELGLYEWGQREGRVSARPVAAGAEVHAVAQGPDGSAWVATEVGLFVRPPGDSHFGRAPGIPATAMQAVRVADNEVWAGARGRLWVRRGAGPFVIVRQGVPDGWWEVVDAVHSGASTLVAVPEGLWRVRGIESERIDLGLRPVRGLCACGQAVWIAAREGIFEWVPPEGPSVGGRLPMVGAIEAFDLAPGPDRVWLAARQGILTLPKGPGGMDAAMEGPAYRAPAPAGRGIVAVQRAALAYLGISPRRLAALDERARWKALWPDLRASFSAGRERARTVDRDESVSGGALWSLLDRERDRESELRIALEASWDLERLASPSDAIAVSRERREVVELLERILDRVNQSYFERERVLARLEGLSPDDGSGRFELMLRARELTAALDGWTGGTFTRLAISSPQDQGESP